MKRKSLLLAALLLAVTFCFGLAACAEGKVALKDFPAEKTKTAELGSVYELKTQAEGEDGNVYRLSSEVVTGDGGAVAVFENKFDVTDISGYTITYTAVVTSGEAPKSVVTLNVTDNTAPGISINKPDAGILNEEYCLPRFTVTDLADSDPAVTVKVSYISGAEKEEVSLTEREGRYYFTPEKLGSYEIAVTAIKSNGKSKTVTRTFIVDQPVLEGEVFSPEVLDPASQISFVAAGGVPTEKLIVGTGTSEEGGYTGKYLSIDGSEIGNNLWVDIHLTPRQSIESYAEYDIVEFWVYFVMTGENAKIGILGGSTAATDPLLREFAGNTWAKISVDAATFFDKIDSARLFTVNFNNATSGNHAGLTEVRIGTVMAKYAFGPEVTVDAPEAVAGGTSAVTLTADTDVAFTAQIKNDKDEVQECVVENGAVTASLPMGSYTYTLTSQDDMYIGSVTGSFTVESKTKIVLPEAAAGTAGTAYTIPDASVTVDGAVQEGEKATCTATFVQGLNGKKSEQVESGFVPLTAGTLTVVYSYEGAASQTLTVEIAAAQPAGNVVFDPSTATSGNTVSSNGIQVYEAVKGEEGAAYEGDYIRITATASSWTNTRLTLGLTDDSYAEYDKIGVWVYYAATGMVTSSLFNDNNYKVQYAPNEWHLVLVDRDAFVEKMTGSQKDLLALAFTVNGVTGSGNFPGLTEVRLGAIVALKSFDEAEVSPIDSVNEGENASVTITVNEDVGSISAVIKNAEGIEQQVTVEGKTVKATLPVGNYTYVNYRGQFLGREQDEDRSARSRGRHGGHGIYHPRRLRHGGRRGAGGRKSDLHGDLRAGSERKEERAGGERFRSAHGRHADGGIFL